MVLKFQDIPKMRGGADLRDGLKTYTSRFFDILRFTNTDVGVRLIHVLISLSVIATILVIDVMKYEICGQGRGQTFLEGL
jgi:hypothetical protein